MSESVSALPTAPEPTGRVVVVTGGTDGMGRALVLARAERGDQVVAIGSNPAKGEALLAEAAGRGAAGHVRFVRADLATVEGNRRVIEETLHHHGAIDALALFANRQAPRRTLTRDGLEATWALYYLSRYLLGHGFRAALEASAAPVIVNVSGVGVTKGSIHWDDLQLERGYAMVAAQLQAGRANDLLGVAFAEHGDSKARYVLYHPGFTRSGDLSPLPLMLRAGIRAAARIWARPIPDSIRAIHQFIDTPPAAALTAVDRNTHLPLTFRTLDPRDAARLAGLTEKLLAALPSNP
ncbi:MULTISPECIES: SDR family NAD(P)-dependent oxidoreductase [unclassified Frankia]|uniref:SDR family NAD(P)-dependent oxidoreductase n=1 Tax=unclassified Frankia TaxID=2632575 RepID=UPI0027DC2E26|nr:MULTISPECIES: SDR family NAD(P)-dependent oxidoreductase [unclassified Frankia]